MANANIKISQLPDIGSNLDGNTLLPVVSTNGTYITDKTTVGNIANLILTQAGNTFPEAFVSQYTYAVVNSAQPNITSIGNLTGLTLTSVSNLHIPGGTNGYVLQTDGNSNLSWTAMAGSGNGNPGGSNTQIQFNDEGLFNGTSALTFDKTTDTLSTVNLLASSATIYGNLSTINVNATGNVTAGNLEVNNFTTNNFTTTGNITANYFIGNGSQLTGITAVANAGGPNTSVQFNSNGAISGEGNFTYDSGNHILNVTRANVSYLTAYETIDGGNLVFANNIEANYLSGDGSNITNLGNVANANYSSYSNVANLANSVAVANVVGIGNISTIALNGNGNTYLRGNGTWGAVSGGSANTGNVTFNDQVVQGTGDEYGGGGLYLAPGSNSEANLQYLRVRGGDNPTHIHFDTGNTLYFDQYFGDDNKYLKLEAGLAGNVKIGTYQDGGIGPIHWTYDSNSNFILPENGTIKAAGNAVPFTSTITNITTGSATVVVTVTDNIFPGPYVGQVQISDVVGTTEANSTWWYQAVDSNQFQLFYDENLTAPVDGSSWTAYVSGGNAVSSPSTMTINAANVTIDTGLGKNWTFNTSGNVVFPTLLVDLHNGGNQNAQTLQFGNPDYQAIITGPTPAVDTNAQRLIIQGQRGNGTGEGGDVYVWAGDADTNGGDIKIYAGDADVSGSGGYINIDAGSGVDGGGQLSFTGGYSTGGQGGPVYISAGQGTAGGVVNINGGGASANAGGYVNIQGGFGQSEGGAVTIAGGGSALGLPGYGNVQITAGVSSWTFDNLGTVTFPDTTLMGAIEGANTFGFYNANNTDFLIEGPNNVTWSFNTGTGNTTVPGAINVGNMSIGSLPGYITANANTGIILNTSGPDGGFVVDYLKEDGNANTSGGELAFNSETGNATYRISLSDDLGDGFATKIWRFDGTGNLSLPSGGSLYSEGYTPSGAPGNTIILNPHGSGSITNQKLMVYPTAGDGDHIHMTTGNLYETELFLGSDSFFVKLANTGNVVVNSDNGFGSTAQWTFGNDSTLTFPGNTVITSSTDLVTIYSNSDLQLDYLLVLTNDITEITNQNNVKITSNNAGTGQDWVFGSSGSLEVPGDVFANGVASPAPSLYGFSSLQVFDNINIGGVVITGSGSNITIPGYIKSTSNATIAVQAMNDGADNPAQLVSYTVGTGGTTAISAYANNALIQANINGDIKSWNFDNTGNLTLPGNTFAVNYANGTQVSLGGGGGNTGNIVFNQSQMQSNVSYNLLNLDYSGGVRFGTAGDEPILFIMNSGQANGKLDKVWTLYDGVLSSNSTIEIGAGSNATITANVSTWTFVDDGTLLLPRDASGNTDPYLWITGGNAPSISSVDVSLAGPANFQIVSDYLNLSGYSGAKVAIKADNGEIATDANMVLTTNNANVGNTYSWTYDTDGNLTLPGNTFSINYANGSQASAPLVDVLNTNGLTTVFYPTFVENRTDGQIVRADVDLSYRSDTNTLTVGNITGNTNGYTLGYLNIPQVAASNTTLALTDAGKHYYSTTAGNLTLTIPLNSSVAFPTGTAVSIVVQAAGNVLVNAAAGVTLYMAGSSSAGNRVVGTYGMATLMKVASDTWFINGTGVY